VEFTAYRGEMMKEGALTSFALYDAYRFFRFKHNLRHKLCHA